MQWRFILVRSDELSRARQTVCQNLSSLSQGWARIKFVRDLSNTHFLDRGTRGEKERREEKEKSRTNPLVDQCNMTKNALRCFDNEYTPCSGTREISRNMCPCCNMSEGLLRTIIMDNANGSSYQAKSTATWGRMLVQGTVYAVSSSRNPT